MSETIEIPSVLNLKPIPAEAAPGALKAKNYAMTIVVNDQASYEIAADEVAQIKGRWNALEAKRDEFVRPLNAVVKSINAFFAGPLANLKDAEDIVKNKMITFRKEEERKAEEIRKATAEKAEKERQEFERKAREEREKKEAEERRHREEEARMLREKEDAERRQREARERELEAKRRGDEDAQRIAREQGEQAERDRKATEDAERKSRADAEKATFEAEERERKNREAAQAVHSAPPVDVAPPKAKGTSAKKIWRVEVTNKLAFIKTVGEGKAPMSLLEVDEGALNRMAQAADGVLGYDGIRTFDKDNLSVRAK